MFISGEGELEHEKGNKRRKRFLKRNIEVVRADKVLLSVWR